ncbi:MAG TPA: lysophospholipid acyltransferase family protein [Gemmatimonadaceae bacterium]|nr:lysophospholipid acyltransferase family protein [Gemmatimonadaceae bacterium]
MSESRAAAPADRVHTPIAVTGAHRAEYAALRAASGALRGLGVRGASGFGARIGGLGFAPLRIRRAVAEEQIAKAFPELPPSEVERIARESYRNLGRTAMETMLLSSRSKEEVVDLFAEVEGWDVVEDRLARGNGLILASGHVGNWELGGAYLAARGLPISAVARHMANPLVDRYLTRTRERLGLNVIHDEQAVRRVPRAIREGGAVAFLVDQAAVGLASTWVPFFGRLAKTPRGPAVFALRLDAPIVFAGVSRRPDGRFRFSFEAVDVPRTGVLDTDVDAIVAAYTNVLETHVRKFPEQYLWQHRRWKHLPPPDRVAARSGVA